MDHTYTVTLTPDGGIEIAPFPTSNSLKYMQEQVGGYVEHLEMACNTTPLDMWVNEEGLLQQLDYNPLASWIITRTWQHYYQPTDHIAYIVGNAVITGSTPDGDTRGITLHELHNLTDIIEEFANEGGFAITREDESA
jgi:hypothetical protein